MSVSFFLIVIVGALVMEAFFSGAETAFVSVNFLKIVHLIEQEKDPRAKRVHDLLKKPDRLLITTLLGTNFSVVVSATCATALFLRLSPLYGALWTTLFLTPLTFIFCQWMPKTVCRLHANRIILWLAWPLAWSERLFWPLVNLFSFCANAITGMISVSGVKKNPFLTKDEIKLLVRDISREGILAPQEKEAIEQIFDMTLTKAVDCMIPMKNVVTVDWQQTQEEIAAKCRRHGYVRFPVLQDKQLKGIINVFDLFYGQEASVRQEVTGTDWHAWIRPMMRIEATESLDTIFSRMQPHKEMMAAVFKGPEMIGVLTMQDVMQDITSYLTPVGKV